MAEPLVLGLGNAMRGDDGVGAAVARELGARAHPGDMAGLLDELARTRHAVLIDASVSGAAPGTIRRFDAADGPLPATVLRVSSHGAGLAEALEMARALDQLPPRCVVYAVEGAVFDHGAPLSPPVAAAVADVAARIRAELRESTDA